MLKTLNLSILSFLLSVVSHAQQSTFPHAKRVLEQNCIICHGEEKQKGGLRLDTRDALLSGGEDNDAINLSDLKKSHLLKLINLSAKHDDIMPPAKHSAPLSKEEKHHLTQWILAKAPYPNGVVLLPKKKLPPLPVLLKDLQKLSVHPAKISLDSKDDFHRFLTYGHYADSTTRDLSPAVKYSITDPSIITLKNNTITPLKNGSTTITIALADKKITLPVTVKNATTVQPITFQQHVMPTFTALGCNTGSCHGSARGQDGFQLSLFGFDPKGDHYRLTQEMIGRRVNLADPANSLILTKSSGKVPHTGGKITQVDSTAYNTLLEWIKNGSKYDHDAKNLPISITVQPKQLVLKGTGNTAQLTVTAHYPDGSDRDVTQLSTFTTSDETSVKVDKKTGTLSTAKRGESFIMARFHTFTEGMQTIVIPEKLDYKKKQIATTSFIDKHVHNKLHKLRIVPSGLCSDEVFIRRLYLDLIGSLPTPAERQAFLTDISPNKRAKLIDQLLERPEFTHLWVMKWSELLQIRTIQNQVSYKAALRYHGWLQTQFKQQKPFNKIVHDLLTTKGGTFKQPATNFYQTETDVKKLTENVAQVFMGTRIQCAQCHNHPFDRWTMNDYYSLASFFTQVKRKQGTDPREHYIFDRSGEIQHPVTKKNAVPKFLGGEKINLADKKIANTPRRKLIADWLTAPENPWFAPNIANIVWDHFFGIGIVHPVDDVRISNPASNPELLKALANRLRKHRFSIKSLARDICNSQTYQRDTKVNASNKLDQRNFSHATVRRIRAEVLLDSIAQVTSTKNKFTGLPLGAKATQIADGNTSNYFLKTFGRASRLTACSCEVKLEPNLSQALHLINGSSVHNRILKGKRIETFIAAKKTDTEIIRELYLTALSREPTNLELQKLKAFLIHNKDPKQRLPILQDIFWSILNSKEFIFNH